jgi:hypothetical protein
MAKKKSSFGVNTYLGRKPVKRRFKEKPLNHRKKLTPSQSRIKKNGSS